jgi:hypothetical protein
MATNHYHVTTHPDDDDRYTTDNLFSALDYAADELDHLADFEHDDINAYGEQGDYESAYNSFVKMERYDNLHSNAANMVKQHNAKQENRAPLYQDDWLDSEGNRQYRREYEDVPGLDQDAGTGDDRLFQSAKHVVQMINVGSPLMIWECSLDDDDEDE